MHRGGVYLADRSAVPRVPAFRPYAEPAQQFLCGRNVVSHRCAPLGILCYAHTHTQYTHAHAHTHTHTHAHTRLSFVSFRGTAAGGMGYWRSRFPYGEQGCTNWAILFDFVSFLRGCRSPCKRCNFSMKWLLKGSDAVTSQKVEFCLKLGLAPYREAIFPRFRKMKLLNRSR